MEQFRQFEASKADVIATLNGVKSLVNQLGGIGLDVSQDIEKIEAAISAVSEDVLRIALLGAFSDGKTSVIAGWLGQVMDNMKIDTDESSDALEFYHPDNLEGRCEIVDTPGLFGDKEKSIDDGQLVRYGDITKNYLSQAHLIFYVVDATNPLKDSHKNIVRWVLRDLNKLGSTIFVINKMDEVADLRDSEDFDQQNIIKQKNLLDKITRFVDLSPAERAGINVICVAANPGGRGLEFWLKQEDLYGERSRINALKALAQKVLDDTSRDALIKKTGMDVVRDVVGVKIKSAEEELLKFKLIGDKEKSESVGIQEQIDEGKGRIINIKGELYDQLNNLQTQLLNHIRTLSRDEVVPFLESELGYQKDEVGQKLRIRITQMFEAAFHQSSTIMSRISVSIERQLDNSSTFADSITRSALLASGNVLNTVSKVPLNTIKDSVLAARNVLASLTGYTFKFKPWGAIKLAGNIGKYAGWIGAAVQVVTMIYDEVKQRKDEEEFKNLKNDLAQLVNEHFAEPLKVLEDTNKVMDIFAPQIKGFEKIQSDLQANAQMLQQRYGQLEKIKDDLEQVFNGGSVIEGKFREI